MSDEPKNVIRISDVKDWRYRLRKATDGVAVDAQRKCKHPNILVDEELSEIECEDCHAKMNPVQWLIRFMREVNHLAEVEQRCSAASRLYDRRSRTKCRHCGRITEIGSPPTDAEIRMEIAMRTTGRKAP